MGIKVCQINTVMHPRPAKVVPKSRPDGYTGSVTPVLVTDLRRSPGLP
jgi:hypothetical protein